MLAEGHQRHSMLAPLSRPYVEIEGGRQRQHDVAGDRHRVVPLGAADHYEHGGHHRTDYRDHLHSSDALAPKRLPSVGTECMIRQSINLIPI